VKPSGEERNNGVEGKVDFIFCHWRGGKTEAQSVRRRKYILLLIKALAICRTMKIAGREGGKSGGWLEKRTKGENGGTKS